MGSNSFGTHFRITTWGESHGPAIGCVVDGCPAGVMLDVAAIQRALDKRAPGRHRATSPRREPDIVTILSGLFEGKTTGTPISFSIANSDVDSSSYELIKDVVRPGHAMATYLQKYGCVDWRGGGRASARETACRVAAGAIAEQILPGIRIVASLKAVGNVAVPDGLCEIAPESPIFCPHPPTETAMLASLDELIAAGDSTGGVVECVAHNVPAGLGDPIYDKIEAKLAAAMLSIPASKGFEVGDGFACTSWRGSAANDGYTVRDGCLTPVTNHAGGTLGGITTGAPLVVRIHFKPTSSIKLEQQTVDTAGNPVRFAHASHSRHDPCVAIRAVPVCHAMMALVLADAFLAQRLARA